MNRAPFLACLVVSAIGLALAPALILGAPTEATMGFVQRIFYYHVPCAMLTFLAAFLCAGGSVAYLFKGSKRGEALAVASAELTVVFGICVLVTGPLWARKAWGVWWVWKDVRLMTTLLLWFIFVAYLFVRRYGGPGSSRLAAGLALFAAADVPIIYTSVFFWRTQHPKAEVIRTLQKEMMPAFWTSFATLFVFFAVLLAIRLQLERNRQRLDEAWLAAEDAGLLDDQDD
jgi:heme exporter protein C